MASSEALEEDQVVSMRSTMMIEVVAAESAAALTWQKLLDSHGRSFGFLGLKSPTTRRRINVPLVSEIRQQLKICKLLNQNHN